jgi:hypothetical protein
MNDNTEQAGRADASDVRDADDAAAALSETEREALHQLELGVEHLHRAHGHLVSFHHDTGRAMNHLDRARELMRETGHDWVADRLRDEHLPRGVVSDCLPEETAGRWSYDVLEEFQDSFLAEVVQFDEAVRERLAGGRRHISERDQEREWKGRARR